MNNYKRFLYFILFFSLSSCVTIKLNESLLFAPDKLYSKNIPYLEEIEINFKGKNFNGVFWNKGYSKLIIYFHGNSGSIWDKEYLFLLRCADSLKCNFLSLDYPGYGKNDGTPSIEGLYECAEASLSYAQNHGFQESNIIIWGFSLGTIPASKVCENKNFYALIYQSGLINADYNVNKQIKQSIGLIKRLFLKFDYQEIKFDCKKSLLSTNVPVLFIHGEKDEITSFSAIQNLYENIMSKNKFLFLVKNASHNDTQKDENRFISNIQKFLSNLK